MKASLDQVIVHLKEQAAENNVRASRPVNRENKRFYEGRASGFRSAADILAEFKKGKVS